MSINCPTCQAVLDEPGQDDVGEDLRMPRGLSDAGKAAYTKTMSFLRKHNMIYTGGCRAFYSPEYWAKHEDFDSTNAILVIVHDGGELSYVLNWDKQTDYKIMEAYREHMSEYLVEQINSWYSAVFID
jgi:hypothetical protein